MQFEIHYIHVCKISLLSKLSRCAARIKLNDIFCCKHLYTSLSFVVVIV